MDCSSIRSSTDSRANATIGNNKKARQRMMDTAIKNHIVPECYIVGIDINKYFDSGEADYICEALYAEVRLNKSLGVRQAHKIKKID